jgi:hypothetical protein
VALPLAILGTLIGLGYLFYATAKDLPVTATDREVLITATHAAEWLDGFQPAPERGRFAKKRFFDESCELSYEYEHPEADAHWSLYVSCVVTVERSTSDARITYTASGTGTRLGLGLSDLELRDEDALFRWGDRSRCALITLEDGTVIGNYFICQDGTRVFELVLSGLYFDEGEALGEFLRPVLGRLHDYRP